MVKKYLWEVQREYTFITIVPISWARLPVVTFEKMSARKQPTRCQHAAQSFNDEKNALELLKGVLLCCCGWGNDCKKIRMEIEHLPEGSNFDLWKQPYAQIVSGLTDKKKKYEEVIRRHLGITGDPPATYKIAPHHFPLGLLQWRSTRKKCQWISPLTNEQAKSFGTSHDRIDCHPKIEDEEGNMLFCQTPNVSKYDILILIKSWSSQRGQRKSRRAGLQHEVPAQPLTTTQVTTGIQFCHTVADTVVAAGNGVNHEKLVTVQPESMYAGRGTKRPLLIQDIADSNSSSSEDDNKVPSIQYTDDGSVSKDEHVNMFDSIESVIHTNTLPVYDTTELVIAHTCQGIQHVKVRQYLSCTEMRYASLRGIALLHWKYNNVQKSWHATNCTEDIPVHLQDKNNCCVACRNVQNKIRKKTYPWLFQETSMLPSDDEIV